jgi:Leucine-rich repeat (LRR) protein
LHLSYNRIPPAHIENLQILSSLLILNLASNELCTLPSDMSYLKTLEEFNLASNNFSSSMTLVSASTIFDALSTIPSLKKLNLSRNRLEAWHGTKKFPNLIELYFAFNQVQEEQALLPALETNPNLSIFVITGNPFAANLTESILEKILYDKFGSQGQLINESLNPPSYLRGARTRTAPETSTAF